MYGKTVGILGDSIMESYGIPTVMAQIGKFNIVNFSKGGTSIGKRRDDGTYDNRCASVRTSSNYTGDEPIDVENCDYILLAMGTNDRYPDGLGDVNNGADMENEYTMVGATNITIKNLLTRNPLCKILVSLPMYRTTGEEPEMNQSIKAVAEKYHLPILDMYNVGGINELNVGTYLNPDKLHPTQPAGRNLIAQKMAMFIVNNY